METEKPKFNRSSINPLTELTELRLSINPVENEFDLLCQLRFGTADVELEGRGYSVGITEARLQLSLEGCETTMGSDFGVANLSTGTEEKSRKLTASIGGSVGGSLGPEGLTAPSMNAKVGAEAVAAHILSVSREMLPMTALPNNAWRIREASTGTGGHPTLCGSAMEGQRLCQLQRKEGGNRVSVSAELQIKRSSIAVSPSKGNTRGKLFSRRRNQDAVVAKVLERAIRREASSSSAGSYDGTVVASFSEITEE
jgi:hypothetical protein